MCLTQNPEKVYSLDVTVLLGLFYYKAAPLPAFFSHYWFVGETGSFVFKRSQFLDFASFKATFSLPCS